MISTREVPHVAAHLQVLAREAPERPALLCPEGSLNYRELEEYSNRCACGLERLGIQQGTRTILMVRPGIEFVILAFALIKLAAVLVLVDPGIGRKNLRKCLEESKSEAFIGIPLAQLARLAFGWARRTLRLCITVGPFLPWGSTSFQEVMRLGKEGLVASQAPRPDDTAAIVFTSGSTGSPKGVVYTHGMFSAQVALLRDHFGIEPGEVDLATFPLFALFDPALRVTTVFPRMDFTRPGQVDPRQIIQPIHKFRVTHMFGSPALLDRVGRYAEQHSIKLPSIRRVLSAGAPVQTRILKRFRSLLEAHADVHTPYGATEALPISSISGRELLQQTAAAPGRGVCVGRAIAGVNLAVIRIVDEPIAEWTDDLQVPAGQIGELVVWGPNVSREYFERPEANRLAKIRTTGGEVLHRMGDVGYLDEQQQIWFCGRKSQRVISAGTTLFTVPCEGIFNQHPEIRRTALVGLGEPPRQRPVLCVELENQRKWKGSARLKEEILALGKTHPQTRHIDTLLFHPAFPVDPRHNAKIYREKLARWAAKKLS